MDLDTVNYMKKLSHREVDLEALKNEVLEDVGNETKQVKFFRTYKRNGNALDELQKQINEFLAVTSYVEDIKFNVQKNFLLGSTSGEYEEDAYAMVIYEN